MSIVHKGKTYTRWEDLISELEDATTQANAVISNRDEEIKRLGKDMTEANSEAFKDKALIRRRGDRIEELEKMDIAHREAVKITTDVHATEIKSHKDRIEREKGIVEALAGNIHRAIQELNRGPATDRQKVVDILLDSDDDPCPMCKQSRRDGGKE